MKQHQSSIEVRSPAHWILPAALAATVSLHVAGIFLPGISAWGFNIWTEFPHWIGLAAAAGTMLVACLSLAVSTQNVVTAPATATDRTWVWLGLLGLGTYIITVMLGPAALVYGDGYAVVQRSVEPISAGLQDVHALTKPLPTMLWRLATNLLTRYWNFSATNIVSFVGGLIGASAVAGLWSLATLLCSHRSYRVLIFLVSIAGGSTLLFLGHVEYYVWSAAALIWLMVVGLGRNSKTGIIPLVVISALSLLTNVMLLPAVVVTILMAFNRRRGAPLFAVGKWRIRHGVAIIALLVVSTVAVVLVQFAANRTLAFVPPLPVAGNAYSALSLDHLRDTLNWLFFFAPIGLPLLVITVLCGASVRSPEHVDLAYLASIAWVSFLVSFWVDPQLGAVRDWDLLSFVGIPLSLYGAATYTRWLQERRVSISRPWLAAVAAASLFVLVPHIVEEHDLNRAVVRLDRLLWQDPHYQVTYKDADRCVSWGSILGNEPHRFDLSEKYFRRYIAVNPVAPAAWYSLGQILYDRHSYDSALVLFNQAAQATRENNLFKIAVVETYRALGKDSLARSLEGVMQGAARIDAELERRQALSQAEVGHLDSALYHFKRAYTAQPNDCPNTVNLGLAYSQIGKEDSALIYYEAALTTCPRDNWADIYQSIVISQLALKHFAQAGSAFEKYRELKPTAPDIPSLQRRIANGLARH